VTAAVIHASAVAFGPAGAVLIEGPSGSGKSALALALIGAGADLVADDRTVIFAQGGVLYARAPAAIAGLVEVRGLGVIRLAARRLARVRLVLALGAEAPPRLPPAATCRRLGCELPFLAAAARPGPALALGLARQITSGRAADPALAAV
jgi:HPr kinase/phosphorylase